MILNELIPLAVKCGIPYQLCFHMTPHAIRLEIEGYADRKKNEIELAEHQSWMNGYYTMHAIGANLSKKIKYPKSPLEEERVIVEDMELTEEEKETWRNKLFNKLQNMGNKCKANEG